MKKNIVFFVHSIDSGGIENYILRFLHEKYLCFGDIYIYCKSGTDGQLRDSFLELPNVTIIKSKIGYLDYNGLISLYNFLKTHNISSICDFTGNFSGLILLTAYLSRVPKRVAFYRSSTDRFENGFFRNIYNSLMNRLVSHLATDILANSKTAMTNYFKDIWIDNYKYEVVYNGINAKKFLSDTRSLRDEFRIPKDAFVIGHTGRYNPAKNHDTIIAVAEILIKSNPNIYFILCGNGVRDHLLNTILKKGLDKNVLLFENRQDIPRFLSTMDCYFFPSITEGQPNALIEAMIMGLPFVASNIEPIREIVFDITNLYPPYDIESFVNKLSSFYKNPVSKIPSPKNKYLETFDHNKNFNKFLSRLI